VKMLMLDIKALWIMDVTWISRWREVRCKSSDFFLGKVCATAGRDVHMGDSLLLHGVAVASKGEDDSFLHLFTDGILTIGTPQVEHSLFVRMTTASAFKIDDRGRSKGSHGPGNQAGVPYRP
jgi:hypothetical protein